MDNDQETKLTVLLPKSLRQRFKELCAAYGTEMSKEIRGFIEDWISKKEGTRKHK